MNTNVNIRLQKVEKCNEDECPYQELLISNQEIANQELLISLMYLAASTRPNIANIFRPLVSKLL